MEIKPSWLESFIGMEVYKSRTDGIGGVIKAAPEDFLVEEITPEGTVLEALLPAPQDQVGDGVDGIAAADKTDQADDSNDPGGSGDFVGFTLQKYNWDTLRAVSAIANHLHMSHRRIGFAGTKDKRALTTQRVSISNGDLKAIKSLRIKDLYIRDPRYCLDHVGLGDLWGNRFSITVRDLDLPADEIRERIEGIIAELRGQMPAFYGVQRFGTTRPITHLVGKEMLKGDYKSAVMVYLTKEFEGEERESSKFRKDLAVNGDYREALKNLPRHLGYEAALLNHLVKEPEDYAGALKRLPERLCKMFIHAYQGYVFNRALSEYMRRNIPVERLPLVGFQSQVDEITESILEEEGIKKEQFRLRNLSSCSSRGEYRDCFIPVHDLGILESGPDPKNPGKNMVSLRFSLQKGNYATVLLREFMKSS